MPIYSGSGDRCRVDRLSTARCAVTGYVVVGVTAQQPPVVVDHAVRFARRFEAVLVCAHVAEPATTWSLNIPMGRWSPVRSIPTCPTGTPRCSTRPGRPYPALAREEQVQVEFRELAGDIGQALSRLAEVLDAEMIVVGSRRGGLRASVHDFFGGSVAVHLAHRQPRPWSSSR